MFKAEYTEKFDREYGKVCRSNSGRRDKSDKLRSDILEHPRSGIGRPERLKYFPGEEVWSRRVDQWNRLVYKIFDDGTILFDSCLGHYGKS